MKIHHLRSATLIIESGDNFILVDPMLGDVATQPYYTFFRFKARKKNPLVPLLSGSKELLQKVTHCLITHKHQDHIDKEGIRFLTSRNISVLCSLYDKEYFVKQGLNIIQSVDYWGKAAFFGGFITGIPARHGYGYIAKSMGNVMGFYIELPDEPSIYISSDTIYTDDVEKALKNLRPDVAVVACGSAQLDFGKPILMRMDDIIKFVKNSPNKVIANHLEALNHCPATRLQLRKALNNNGLLEKVYIPDDGDTLEILL
ncbi:MAG: MBL fold metallo-hydrolase [Bacteroidales bacterium]|nr:MBL fold metallo-hydrolase [Bacteroidales bacterium]